MAQWLEREFTDRKVLGPSPTSASRHLLSVRGQPGSIPGFVLPSGGTAARQGPCSHCVQKYDKNFVIDNFFLNSYIEGPNSSKQFVLDVIKTKDKDSRSTVTLFRCLTAMPPEGSTRAGIPPGCPSLDSGSREADVRFEPGTFRTELNFDLSAEHSEFDLFMSLQKLVEALRFSDCCECFFCYLSNYIVQICYIYGESERDWLEPKFTDRKFFGSNPTSTSRFLLCRLRKPGGIPVLILPSCGTVVTHRKGDTAEVFFSNYSDAASASVLLSKSHLL
ncbi:hypothetical protein CSKR_103765 [Clonorchis sinensis]|uniref:Uncharacterized protein n=1 Tax=Clonorchis sinensis TaxID=79923 RepID=A0A419PY09_CLOSI|nr:hypothetical protein CSKR_103765 [Clonorchis sinensis]